MGNWGLEFFRKLIGNENYGKLVVVESPYKGDNYEKTERNLRYTRECMNDCFKRGEFPFASHLLYPQEGILDDKKPQERMLGIEAGLAWAKHAELSVVYEDFGISEGMKQGIERAKEEKRPIEYRRLYTNENFRKSLEDSIQY